LNFYHPAMQETLLEAAESAGADVRRGAVVREIRSNGLLMVSVEHDGKIEETSARLVVGVDGRNSIVRTSAGFETRRDPPFLMIGGILADRIWTDEETGLVYINPDVSQAAAIFPQGGGRARVYAMYPAGAGFRLQGEKEIPRFIEETVKAGVPRDVLSGVEFSGPLASFDAADAWVDGPYRDGIALIGDAAASNNPSWGQGLSLALRDVRVLAEALGRHGRLGRGGTRIRP
jgi:2-polyprenyl-6-methoxyphenol hydroxylase-like FAD-dependent oxidoreductase